MCFPQGKERFICHKSIMYCDPPFTLRIRTLLPDLQAAIENAARRKTIRNTYANTIDTGSEKVIVNLDRCSAESRRHEIPDAAGEVC